MMKYLIFISSSMEDLKTERAALSRVIWELGHIPVVMDGFDPQDPGDEPVIKKHIACCDYFVSLVAHKYGLQADGTSRSAFEYDQALKAKVPVLALLIDEKARWKQSLQEHDEAVIKTLAAFKEKLQSHPHEWWSGTQELKNKARSLILHELFLNPRQGWSPGDASVHPQVVNELGRLIGENEKLKRVMAEGREQSRWHDKLKHTLEMLAVNKESLSFYYVSGSTWENTIKCRYLRIFKLLAPELYTGKTTADLSRFLGSILNPDLSRAVRKDFPTPSNTIKKIMTDLNLLKLVRFSGEAGELWELSDYGKELYGLYRLRHFERLLKGIEPKQIES